MADCDAILRQGVFDDYQFRDAEALDAMIAKAMAYSRDELERIVTSNDTSVGISIPLAKAILQAEAENKYDSDRLKSIREEYRTGETSVLAQSHSKWIMSRVASQAVLDAWQNCVRQGNQPGSITHTIDGDPNGEFVVALQWVPRSRAEADQRSTKIRQVTMVGVQPIGILEFAEGVVLDGYTGLASDFKRVGTAEATLTITVDGLQPVIVKLPPIKTRKVTNLAVKASGPRNQIVRKEVTHSRQKESVWRQGRQVIDELWSPPEGWSIEGFTHKMRRTLGEKKDDCPGGVEAYRDGNGIRMKFSVYHGPFVDRYRCCCAMDLRVTITRSERVDAEGSVMTVLPGVDLDVTESEQVLDFSTIDRGGVEDVRRVTVTATVADLDGVASVGTGVFEMDTGAGSFTVNGVKFERLGHTLIARNVLD